MTANSLAILALVALVALLALLAHGKKTGAYPEINLGTFFMRFRRLDEAPPPPGLPPSTPDEDDGPATGRAC